MNPQPIVEGLTPEDAPAQPGRASGSVRHPGSRNAARAKRNAAALEEAKAEGFGNVSARSKAARKPKNWWALDKRNCYTEHASAEPATPLLDRLTGGSGPVRSLPVSEWREREPMQPAPDTRHLAGIWK